MDHPILNNTSDEAISWLSELKRITKETNEEWAGLLGINPAAAITTVKPSGTVSQLVNCSSGIHPRLYRYYIRTVRTDRYDPIGFLLVEQGIPYTKDKHNYYFKFPIKSPDSSIVAEQCSATDQLKLWELYATHWCDHNPSQTIYYTDDTFLEVGQWVWEHFDKIGGLSFFPYTNNIYENNPYIPITQEKYEELIEQMPAKINWDALSEYEKVDNTTSSQEFACSGGQCEIS
jgi:ribonucleoside-diphosphate reductase alpha chain